MSEPVRLLRRSRHKRMLGGVCAGLADYFGLDPTLVRIVYVVGSIVSVAFPGILVYIILCFVIPMESDNEPYRPE
jgi:phage shock protein C